jgi:integrase
MSESTVCIPIPQPRQAEPVILSMHKPQPAPRKRKKGDKPAKPYPDFPLFPHATKRWAKKIRGDTHYFGPWSDPQAALNKYLEQKDDLHAGRTPRPAQTGNDLDHLCNHFLHTKRKLVEAGELTERTWQDYAATAALLLAHFGRTRLVADLGPDDFVKLRAELAKTRGPVTLGNEIIRIRVILKYAADFGIIAAPIASLKTTFKKPSAKTVRQSRAAKGVRMFEPAELVRILKAAKLPLKCWVLLGINCGFGNADCGRVPVEALDLDGGWSNYHREKTGILRRAKLWPETIAALREWLAIRPQPADEEAGKLVFLSPEGASLFSIKTGVTQAVGKGITRVLKALKIKGCKNFYALRHTFETVAGESRDQAAVDHVMGHVRNDVASAYRELISDERLAAVAATVREWLYGKPGAK